ncbi:hypothetical protein OsJ_06671 [Oryza sativa Japonica Group]|uniref:Aminotransferase-like plant mobile domain-containing protein n=1 Tax=Oryza sativa subsp. japonica TaxID=39947 RepID=B9EZW9_ORYSJ|nr:hypothetical protein OsJ_06671 [Oryza sativa Japonica Group]
MTIACSIQRFLAVVANFDKSKISQIERIGFGRMLALPDITLHRKLIGQIAERYDSKTETINIQGTAIPITTHDVKCIMGLPADGMIIKPKPHMNGEDYKYYSMYKQHKGKNISLHELARQINSAKHPDEHFLRRFVLFTIGYILCPTTKPIVSSQYLALLKDIDNIKNINWARITRDYLINCLNELKGGRRNLEGNVPLLQFWAWEHVHINDPMCTLTYVGRPPPLMAYWNEMNVMTWLKYDKKCILETGTVVVVIDDPEEIKGDIVPVQCEGQIDEKKIDGFMEDNTVDVIHIVPEPEEIKGDNVSEDCQGATAENNNGDFIKDDTPTNEEPDYMFKATKERTAANGFNSHGRGDDDESPHHVYIEDDVNVPSSPENFKYPEASSPENYKDPEAHQSANFDAIMTQLMQIQQGCQFLDNKISTKLISIENTCIQNRRDIQAIKYRLGTTSRSRTFRKFKPAAKQEETVIDSRADCRQDLVDDSKNYDSQPNGTATSPHIIESDDNSQQNPTLQLSTIGGRLRRPEGRIIKPTHKSQTDFIYYKKTFPKPVKSSREPKPHDLSLLDEVTLSYISKSEDKKLLSTIAGIKIFRQHLKPLILPKQAPSKAKWLNGTVIDAYIQIIIDKQSDTPRGQGIALLETATQCQLWKINGTDKGTCNKRYRDQRSKVAAIKGIEKYLRYAKQDEHKTYKWNSTNITKWPICPMQVPQQKDGWSCGLFTLKCIEHWNGKDLSPEYDAMASILC